MEAGEAVRRARQLAGLSQRALALRAGVAPSVVADLESGASGGRWTTVTALLAAVGLDLAVVQAQPEASADLESWLYLSTSQRLFRSLGGRGQPRASPTLPVWGELARLARTHLVRLDSTASAGVWLPDHPVPLPLAVVASPRHYYPGAVLPEPTDVVVSGVCASLTGAVAVGVSVRHDVFVLPPGSPELVCHTGCVTPLRTAARLLDAGLAQDEAARRTPAHRQSRPAVEADVVMGTRRYGPQPREVPDPRRRRDWRLGGEGSLQWWLDLRRYPR